MSSNHAGAGFAERAARGRAARQSVPRSAHAALDLAAGRDPLALLRAQDATRVPELVPIRYGRMSASPLAFFRGAAVVMANDLARLPRTGLDAQLSGDAHLLNFGGFATPERNLVFDVNDFDETLPGPFEWDVKRLAASLEIAGRHRGFAAAERRGAVHAALHAYRRAIRRFARMTELQTWYARLDAESVLARVREEHDRRMTGAVRRAVDKARANDGRRALAKLTREAGGGPRIVSEPPRLVPIAKLADREAEQVIEAVMREYGRSLESDRQTLLGRFHRVDAARMVVGVRSVGTRCWIALLLGDSERGPLFLQLKEAQESVLEPLLGRSACPTHAQRVLQGQRLLQASSDALLGWGRAPDVDGAPRSFYVRQLRDWKASLELETIRPRGLALYADACGWTLARAHARGGDAVAIGSYLGGGRRFDDAVAEFAAAYAEVNERDHRALVEAVAEGRIAAEQA